LRDFKIEEHFVRLLTMIPEDRSKVDIQPLFFAFSMNAAIEILTSEDLQSEERRFLTKDDNIVEFSSKIQHAQQFKAYRAATLFGCTSAKETRKNLPCKSLGGWRLVQEPIKATQIKRPGMS
jgi:hypothetical protein